MPIDAKTKLAEIDPEFAWQKWSPADQEPWDEQRVRLLYRRGGFGSGPKEIARALKEGPEQCIATLLGEESQLTEHARQVEVFEKESGAIAAAVRAGGDIDRLAAWWLHRMLHSPQPALEKTTLFWHGHFATGADKVVDSELMYEQNRWLRQHALGDFRAMVHGISKDAAMLLYLDSATNRKAHPNENYARELMELFCLGEGNYTEKDVQELARCFTGWEIRRKLFRFNEYQHDEGVKTLLGRSEIESGESAIDVVLAQEAMPYFVVGKLVKFFVMDEPQASRQFLEPLVKTFIASDYSIRHVVHQILSSNLMLSLWSVGRKVRSPVEYALEIVRSMEATANLDRLAKMLRPLGQALFYPPNVKGWDGGRAWINSSTLIGRSNFVVDLLGDNNTRFAGGSLENWIRAQGVDSKEAWMEWLTKSLVAVPIPDIERDTLQKDMAGRTNANGWTAPLISLSQNPRIHLS
jgi:uncharacterized protein (DUF1800 family)